MAIPISGDTLRLSASSLYSAIDYGNSLPLVLSVTVNETVSESATFDSGATSCFADQSFVDLHHFPLQQKEAPETLHVVDGREFDAGKVTHQCPLRMSYDGHQEHLIFQVTKLAEYPIILGKSWLNRNNAHIVWPTNAFKLSFG